MAVWYDVVREVVGDDVECVGDGDGSWENFANFGSLEGDGGQCETHCLLSSNPAIGYLAGVSNKVAFQARSIQGINTVVYVARPVGQGDASK